MAEFRRLLFFADRGKDRSTYLDMGALPDHLIERIAAGEMIEAVLASAVEGSELLRLSGVSEEEADGRHAYRPDRSPPQAPGRVTTVRN